MDSQQQACQITVASEQAANIPSGCKACKRQWVAIYPLRVAAVPKSLVKTDWLPTVPHQDTELKGGEFKYALRTLREGYVYVLLDDTVWQGYQVTDKGFLRQFNAYEMPESEKVEPLREDCLAQNHDIQASFINIDPKVKKAAVAFSSDPWSKTVLEEYQCGTRPITRFTQVNLSAGKVTAQDTTRTLTLDSTLSNLKSEVLEFAAQSYPNIADKDGAQNGAHGFHPRTDPKKQIALGNHIAQLAQQYSAPVTALIMDDAVGVVEELNNARMDVVTGLAKYRSDVETMHKSTISDTILYIQESMAKQIEADPNIKAENVPIYGDFGVEFMTISREQMVESAKRSATERMQEYYNEPDRAKFARTYKANIETYLRQMTAVAKDLEAWYNAKFWLMAIRHDYSPATSVISWAAQMKTLAIGLQGGMVGMDQDNSVWHGWMENHDSPPFMSLLGKTQGLVQAVYDGSATYSNVKTVFNSLEACDFIDSLNFNTSAGSLAMSMNGAFSLVGDKLSQKANDGFIRTMQALAYVSEGEPVITIFSGTTTIGEFQDTQLSQFDNQGRQVWSTLREGKNSTQTISQTGVWQKVNNPEILARQMPVKYAVLLKDIDSPAVKRAARKAGTSVSALRNGSMLKDGSRLADFPNLIAAPDLVDKALTTGEMQMSLGDSLRIARQQYQLPRRVWSSNGLGFVLGAAMIAIQTSAMRENIKKLKEAMPGDALAEMKITSSALMVTAAAVESVGLGHMVARWGTNPWELKPNATARNLLGDATPVYAHPLIRVAGVIGGVASIVDGIGMFMSAQTAGENGDTEAKNLYLGASFFTTISGVVGIYAGIAGNFALLGPIGFCIGLAILGAVLATMAESEVRSQLEVWLSDTCFGIKEKRGKYDKIWSEKSFPDLQDAMKAYYTIASGVSAQLQRERMAEIMLNSVGTELVAVRVKLPGCDKLGSDWLVELTAKGTAGSQVLSRAASVGKLGDFKAPAKQSFDISPIGSMGIPTTLTTDSVLKENWEKSGLLLEGEFALNQTRFTNAELTVTYWPDKSKPDVKLQLTANS